MWNRVKIKGNQEKSTIRDVKTETNSKQTSGSKSEVDLSVHKDLKMGMGSELEAGEGILEVNKGSFVYFINQSWISQPLFLKF